jgi:hypothetical protein
VGTGHTGTTALATTERAALVDDVANDILANYLTDGQYQSGMTQEQIDTTVTF